MSQKLLVRSILAGVDARIRGGETYCPPALGELALKNTAADPLGRGVESLAPRLCLGDEICAFTTCIGIFSLFPVVVITYAWLSFCTVPVGCCIGRGGDIVCELTPVCLDPRLGLKDAGGETTRELMRVGLHPRLGLKASDGDTMRELLLICLGPGLGLDGFMTPGVGSGPEKLSELQFTRACLEGLPVLVCTLRYSCVACCGDPERDLEQG